ncbi:hypothetical protein ES332_A04G000500v1 [Gossypium tomentosum]|uniref:Uncharacterized protein n=1 Tax=Gossypium tomentosum TaxID=34277 RepID=A0A5D2QSQ2_GOSTO|nr:hypothetical protein ES332_A04G000500v1 [Gossypium tomentosum]
MECSMGLFVFENQTLFSTPVGLFLCRFFVAIFVTPASSKTDFSDHCKRRDGDLEACFTEIILDKGFCI